MLINRASNVTHLISIRLVLLFISFQGLMLNDDSILLPEKPVTQPGEITFNVRVGIMRLKQGYLDITWEK